MKHVFEKRTRIPAPAAKVYAWHESPDAFEKLIPPGEPVKIADRGQGIRDGSRVVLEVGPFPFRRKWVAEHRDCIAGRQFRDVQVQGPFKSWEHTHLVMPDGSRASVLVDHVEYELPFGVIGDKLLAGIVRRKIESMFEYRHRITYGENAALA